MANEYTTITVDMTRIDSTTPSGTLYAELAQVVTLANNDTVYPEKRAFTVTNGAATISLACTATAIKNTNAPYIISFAPTGGTERVLGRIIPTASASALQLSDLLEVGATSLVVNRAVVGASNLSTHANLAALQATSGRSTNDLAFVLGEGWYRNAGNTGEAAVGTLIVADADGKEWYLEAPSVRAYPAWYDIRQYGATTALANASSYIQAAIDAAEAAGGGVVFFPPGTWNIGTKLTVDSANVVLYGPRATLQLVASTNTGIIRLGATEGTSTQLAGIKVVGLTFDGNKANQSHATTGTLTGVVAAVETYNLDSPEFRDVTIKNAEAVGWKLWGDDGSGSGLAANTLASGIYIYASGGTGLLIANAKLGRFSDVFIQDSGNIGIEIVNDHTVAATCEELVFNNLHVHNSTGVGLALYSGCTRMMLSNVMLTLNAGGGFLCGANDPYNNSIANNGSVSGVFSGFLIRKGGTAGNIGLQVDRGSKNTFTGFHITDHDTNVYLANTVRNQFSNFTFITAATLHINCVSGAVDNQFYGLFFAHPASSNNYINVNSGATGNTFRGIDDYDVTKIAVNAAATGTGFGLAPDSRSASGATVTVSVEDQIVLITGTGAVTVNLPANPEPNRPYHFKDAAGDGGAFAKTLTPTSGNIDGAATLAIGTNYGGYTLVHNGTQWYAIASF